MKEKVKCESLVPNSSELPRLRDKHFDPKMIILHEAVEQFLLLGKICEENLESLKAIQKVISLEEGQDVTLNEVLARVLQFYRIFVPYREKTK